MKRKMLLIPVVLLLVMSTIAIGCPPPDPVVPVPPVPVVEVIEWVGQTKYPAGSLLHILFERWAERVYEVSGGRLSITMYPVGTFVGWPEVFGAVSEGVFDVGSNWPAVWHGKDPVFLLFCGGEGIGLSRYELAAWKTQFGGWELFEELYARYNIVPLPPSQGWGPDIFLWADKPIETLEDLQGLKLRSAGFGLRLFEGLGAVPIHLPGGEIIPALEKGVIDAADFINFSIDVPLGLHEVAPYAVILADRAPACSMGQMVNWDSWHALPRDLQEILYVVSWEQYWYNAAYLTAQSMAQKEIAVAAGTTIVIPEPEVAEKLAQVRAEALAEWAAECAFFAEVLESLQRFVETYRVFHEEIEDL